MKKSFRYRVKLQIEKDYIAPAKYMSEKVLKEEEAIRYNYYSALISDILERKLNEIPEFDIKEFEEKLSEASSFQLMFNIKEE
jgi:superfamily II DNA or RNA helicase